MKKRVRAIIIQDNALLLIHRIKAGADYWVFPGGGLEDSDTSPQTGLQRECLEELGVIVAVKDLFMEIQSGVMTDELEMFYWCRIISGEIGTGAGPELTRDPAQRGTYAIEWIHLAKVAELNVYPTTVRDKLLQ